MKAVSCEKTVSKSFKETCTPKIGKNRQLGCDERPFSAVLHHAAK